MKVSSACPICQKDVPHTHPGLTRPDFMQRKWIGVDFDGTLAYEAEDRSSPYTLGLPIETMVNRVKAWLAAGYRVKLFTARMCAFSYTAGQIRDLAKMGELLETWCFKHIGQTLEITNRKDGLMEVLWDDRAVRVLRDTGMAA